MHLHVLCFVRQTIKKHIDLHVYTIVPSLLYKNTYEMASNFESLKLLKVPAVMM